MEYVNILKIMRCLFASKKGEKQLPISDFVDE